MASEYEGHIIRGQIQTPEGETLKQIQNKHVSADIAFVGKDIRYVQGQVDVEGNARFYTSNIFGINDIVAAAWGANGESYQMNILSPFCENLPKNLPNLNSIEIKTIIGKKHRHTATTSCHARFS